MKINRLVSVLLIIIQKKKVTAKELSNTFGVSIRTIQRDIDNLCNAGIPIYSEVGKNGGYHITENYKLDKNYISQKEINTLVGILNGFKDTLFKGSVRDLLNKFSIFSDNGTKNKKLLIDTKPWGNPERQNKKLDEIYKATEISRLLIFDYTDLHKNMTKRKIEPYTIIMKGNSWYIYAYCHLRNDYRLFNTNRMLNIELEETFTERTNLKPIEDFKIDRPRPSTEITMKIINSFQIPEYLNYIDEILDVEGNRIIKCSLPIDEWLYSVFLSLSNDIEIMEPNFVRAEVTKRIKKSIEIYNL